jgi:hypothetical protein
MVPIPGRAAGDSSGPRNPAGAKKIIKRQVDQLGVDAIGKPTLDRLNEQIDSWRKVWLADVDRKHLRKPGVGEHGAQEIEKMVEERDRLREEISAPPARRAQVPGRLRANNSDPELLAGRRKMLVFAQLLGLAVMFTADFAGLFQAVELVLRKWPAITLVVVATLSAGSLLLADHAGREAKDHRRGLEHASRARVALQLGLWLGIGVVALIMRLTTDDQVSPWQGAAVQGQGTLRNQALLFLGLFITSGAVTFLTAYRIHNKTAAAFVRVHDWISRARRCRWRWENEQTVRGAWAEELKCFAEHEIDRKLGNR